MTRQHQDVGGRPGGSRAFAASCLLETPLFGFPREKRGRSFGVFSKELEHLLMFSTWAPQRHQFVGFSALGLGMAGGVFANPRVLRASGQGWHILSAQDQWKVCKGAIPYKEDEFPSAVMPLACERTLGCRV